MRPAMPVAPQHDPRLQPPSYRPQRPGPGDLWTSRWWLAAFFPPLLPREQERLMGELPMAQMPPQTRALCSEPPD
jgi:hypothetical protein